MSDREANLARWAELAPVECEMWQGWYRYTQTGYLIEAGNDSDNRARLLSALISAIRARSWHYKLASDETEVENEQPCAWHLASVFPSKVYPTNRIDSTAAEPCDAMLAAYCAALSALEATEKK